MSAGTQVQDYAAAIAALNKFYDDVTEEDRAAVATFLADMSKAHELLLRITYDSFGMAYVLSNDMLAGCVHNNYQNILKFLKEFAEDGDGSITMRAMATCLIKRFVEKRDNLARMHTVTRAAATSIRRLRLPDHPLG